MKISLFSSLYNKEAESTIEVREWTEAIRDGKYRQTVEQIRAKLAEGLKDEASRLKLKLPAVTVCGVCSKGRYLKFLTERTGLVMLDIDNLTHEQLKAARQLLEVFPWVAILHVTSSGRGLRIVVNMGMVHPDVYREAYMQVAERISEITGLELDMACKDFARASLASYDPDIYYNPKATQFDEYRNGYNPFNYVPVCGPDTSEDFRIPGNVFAQEKNGYGKTDNSSRQYTPQEDDFVTDPQSVIDRFFSTHDYIAGNRHNTVRNLGGYLRWRLIRPWQLNEAIAIACGRAVQPGITAREISAAIIWGYNHGTEGGKEATNKGHKGQNNNMNTYSTVKSAQNTGNKANAESETDEEEVIEEQCIPFEDEIYEHLPQEIVKLLSVAKDRREKDIALISIITVSSNMFPALRIIYGNRKYSPQIYSCVIGEAGSGKGIASNSIILCKKTNKEMEKIYRKAKKEYEKKLLAWELELKTAIKERRLPNSDLKPEEPIRQYAVMSPNTSKSQLIINIKIAGDDGIVIFATEIDTMVEALRTDYGNHIAELRMFFHHEEVSQHFKIDKEAIVVEHPRVAILMTGTPEQVVSLFKSTEDGLFSRFLFYLTNDSAVWKSQSPFSDNGDIDIEELYGSLAEKLNAYFFRTRGKEIMIHFTRDQWARHDEIFETNLGMVSAEGKSSGSTMVKRHGLIVMRIAMVLSGYRIMEAGWDVSEYTCTDEDFETALSIALTGLHHAAHVSTMINESSQRGKVKNYFRLLPILKRMPSKFRYTDFSTAVTAAGFSESAAKRALKKYVLTRLLSKRDGYYYKTRRIK